MADDQSQQQPSTPGVTMDRMTVQRAVLHSVSVWLGVSETGLFEHSRWEDLGVRAPDSLDETQMYVSLENKLGVDLTGLLQRIRDPQMAQGLTLRDTVDDICRDLGAVDSSGH